MADTKLKIRPFDAAFSVFVLIIVVAVPYWYLHRDAVRQKEIKVFKDNKLVAEGPLDLNRMLKVGKMDIEVNGGRVRVLDSDCPKRLCVAFGWISSPGESIVCVANKVIIEVSGKSGEEDFVAMSY